MIFYKKRLFAKTKLISKDELIKKFNNKKLDYIKIAILFGSRANDTYHLKSDYDFAILAIDDNKKFSWGIMSKLWNDIGDILNLPEYDYDIVDLNSANRSIIDSIKESFFLLKGDKDELQRLFNKYN